MRVLITRKARKELKATGQNAPKIRAKIDQYAADPESLTNNVSPLSGRPGYRLRVGNHRVIFKIEDDAMVVLAIGPRGGIYA